VIVQDGQIERYADFVSQHIAPRHVDVWCPPGYAESARRYPVIYMHDGQNLFDPTLAFIGVDWGMDEAITRLMADGTFGGAIVVGIWSSPERSRDYMPQKPLLLSASPAPLTEFSAERGGPPRSDAYLRCLVNEVKPLIDARYRTLPEREHTAVMGSSMGGLVSLYAICEYPAVFGLAGCLSTHWPIGGTSLVDYFGAALPPAAGHRIYFDYGTATLDASYEPYQLRMDALMARAGYVLGQSWLTEKFEGAEHSERAWRARVDIPLRFLFGLG
jgi:predicted alpha/beta superfamily hydrolase